MCNVELLRKELKSYRSYQKKIKDYRAKEEEIFFAMSAIRSPSFEKIGQTPSPHQIDMELMITKKMELEQQRLLLQKHCEWIENFLCNIQDAAQFRNLWCKYILNEEDPVSAEILGEKNRSYYYDIRRVLEEACNERMVQSYPGGIAYVDHSWQATNEELA